jgi:hypothetical protein
VKRLILSVCHLVLAAGFIAAADNYTVQSVSGRVEQNISANKWTAVTADTILSPSTVVDVGLQAALILSDGSKTVTIGSGQRGTVETLLDSASDFGVRMITESGPAGNGQSSPQEK